MPPKSLIPKQRPLTETETQASFESWQEGMEFHISLDVKSARFLTDLRTWTTADDRGFTDDTMDVAEDKRMNGLAKKMLLNIILGSVASLAPVISPKFIKKQSTSLNDIWSRLRTHFGFRKTGARITEFCEFKLEPNESRETLWERMYSFLEDNLLTAGGQVQHEGAAVIRDEVFTPSLLCILVTQWLHTINPSLPAMIRQRFSTQLRTKTVISIREEISDAIPSMLEEIQGRSMDDYSNSGTVSRAGYFQGSQRRFQSNKQYRKPKSNQRKCCLCDQAGRPSNDHYIQSCPFLPPNDRKFISKTRDIIVEDCDDSESETSNEEQGAGCNMINIESEPVSSRRIQIVPSPVLDVEINGVETEMLADCGAEANLTTKEKCNEVGARIRPTKQRAMMADGRTPLKTVGETSFTVKFSHHKFLFSGLVVEQLDSGIVAGMPFLQTNDVFVRPNQNKVYVGDCCEHEYSTRTPKSRTNRCTVTATILRVPRQTCLLPGESFSFQLPVELHNEKAVSIEPRIVSSPADAPEWLGCSIVPTKEGCIDVVNSSPEPILIGKHAQIGQVRPVIEPTSIEPPDDLPSVRSVDPNAFIQSVSVDPSGILPKSHREGFNSLHQRFSSVFSPGVGCYNGHSGSYKHIINMNPNLPPQRVRVPMYNRNDLVSLQAKCDELLAEGVLGRPEDCGVPVEYCHPSFLVKKSSGGFRLVTSFGDFAEFARVSPSAISDVESVLQRIGQWKVIIKTDLKWAYYQIALAQDSMRYTGVVTPFKGTYVYKRSVMGLPGSEAALEEVLCRVLGDLVQDGGVVKLSDDLYCGAETVEELMSIWEKVLERLRDNGMKLSPDKTVCCPTSTTILGWRWENGSIRPTTHRINALMVCNPPDTVKGLRSFIGCVKFMSRVLPSYSDVLCPLEELCAGRKPAEKLVWTEQLTSAFDKAKKHLKEAKPVILPRSDDELHIVTDAALRCAGMASALYAVRKGKPILAGFFNAKRRRHQIGWLPCEVEALCIATSIKHFAPYILQSKHKARVMTDSKACVQAYKKLCKGEFSNSSRLTTFLSIVSRYQIEVMHIAGKDNVLSDFASRNPIQCEGQCQICNFVEKTEQCVVRGMKVADLISGASRVPYASRGAWLQSQRDCPDIVKVCNYISQGISPSGKKKGYSDIRRYLGVATIAKSDGLLVVKHIEPFKSATERIVIPRSVSEGLITALHIQLNHPTKHQLKMVFGRTFFALDMDSIVGRVVDGCHTCAALKNIPSKFHSQSTSAPDKIGSTFSSDVLRGSGQCILVLRESISSFTDAMIVQNEQAVTLREGIATLASKLRSPLSHQAIIRTDPASALRSLLNDDYLKSCNMSIELGDEKNINKNPIAEKAIEELRVELVRMQPLGGKISPSILSRAVSNMNSRIRHNKLSAYEVWTRREMSTGNALNLNDSDLISNKVNQRVKQHIPSAKSKARGYTKIKRASCKKGDIVYLFSDRDKTRSRDKYLVVGFDEKDDEYIYVQKFTGSQLRTRKYHVKLTNIITVSSGQVVPQETTHEVPSLKTPHSLGSATFHTNTPDNLHKETYDTEDSDDSDDDSDDEWTISDLLPHDPIITQAQPVHVRDRLRRNRYPPRHHEDYVILESETESDSSDLELDSMFHINSSDSDDSNISDDDPNISDNSLESNTENVAAETSISTNDTEDSEVPNVSDNELNVCDDNENEVVEIPTDTNTGRPKRDVQPINRYTDK